MENKDQNDTLSTEGNRGDSSTSYSGVVQPPADLGALSLEQAPAETSLTAEPKTEHSLRRFLHSTKPLNIALALLLLIITAVVVLLVARNDKNNEDTNAHNQFTATKIPLKDILSGQDLTVSRAASVTINGTLQVGSSLSLAPSLQPTGARPGQIYYDKGTNQLAYYNGSNFVFLTGPQQTPGGIQSLGGATGLLTLGSGLDITNNQLSNNGVLAVQGQSGNITLTAGPGIVINGTNFSNSGVLNITAGTPNVTITKDGSGGVSISVASPIAGTGTVTSGGGTAGRIPVFTAAQNIEDSIISQAGLGITVGGDLTVTGALNLSSPLAVGQGGTGSNLLTGNGVLVGNGSAAVSSIVAGGAGLCLMSTAGAPTWGVCPGGGGSGVSSLNGLTGGLTIANASAAGSTITIDDATTSTKGIASFNGTNFGVTGGVVNTAQNINSTATPTFAGINTSGINPSSTLLTVGSSSAQLILQGDASSVLRAYSGANSTSVTFQSPTANVSYRFTTTTAGTYDVCTTAGNCVGTGGGVSTSGGTANRLAKFSGAQAIADSSITDDGTNVATSVDMIIQGGDLTIGVPTAQTGTINLANSGSGFIGSIIQGALSANRTYTLPDADGTICLSSGNCPNTGVTSLNSLSGALTLANSTGAGSTITINDASTSAKGIASFNSTNFTVTAGAVNTVQNISTGSTPTFAGVNTNAITPTGALTVGATAQALTLQGSAGTQLVASSGANSTTVNFQSPTANVTYRFLTAPAGSYDICTTQGNCAGTGGGVTTAGGSVNRLSKFSGAQAIADSSITDDGTNVLTSIDMVIQGGDLTIGVPTSQTGTINLANNGSGFLGSIVQGALSANRTYTLPDADGTICLSSGNCPVSGVTSLNGLVGALNIANASAAGTTITIDNATTSTKGIASFNSTNFTVTSGAVNTAQDINTTASPTFTAVVTSTITPSGTLSVGGNIDASGTLTTGTADAFQVAANGTITTAGSATFSGGTVTLGTSSQAGSLVLNDGSANTGTLNVAALGQNTVYRLPDPGAASADICLSSGNCAGTGGGVTTPGGTTNRIAKFSGSQTLTDSTLIDDGVNVTATGDLVIQGGDVTIGIANSQAGSLHLADGSSAFTGVVLQGSLTANRTYTLPDADGTICLTSGNCAGTGGGVTTPGGTIGVLPVFTGSQSLGDSLVSQSGGTVTVNGNLNLTSGNQFRVNGTQISSANLSNDANLAKLDASQTFTGNAIVFRNAANSTSSFSVQNASSGPVLNVDTTNNRVGIGTATPGYVLDVVGDINTTTQYRINGTPICTASGCTAAAGSGNYIQNTTTPQTANIAVQSAADSSISMLIKQRGTQTANLLNVVDSNSVTLFAIDAYGSLYQLPKASLMSEVGIGMAASSGQQLRITVGGPASTGITLYGNSSQTADLVQVYGSGTRSLIYNAAGTLSLAAGSGQSADLFALQDTSGAVLSSFGSNGQLTLGRIAASGVTQAGSLRFADGTNDNFAATINTATLSANRTVTLPNESGTLCVQNSTNCGFALSSGSGSYIQNGTSTQTANFNIQSAAAGSIGAIIQGAASQTADILQVKANGVSTPLLAVSGTGIVNLQATALSTSAFNIKTSAGNNIFTVDTTNSRVGIGLGGSNVPTLNGAGLELRGALRVRVDDATMMDIFTTPVGATVRTIANFPVFSLPFSGQVIALGVASTSDSTARGITITDARTSAHHPSLAVFSPDENQVFGLSWDGLNTTPLLKSSTTSVALQANSLNILTALNSSGTARVGIGNGSPSYPLDVTGDINTTTQYRIGGVVVCTATGCAAGSGSTNYIQNGTSVQSANFNVQSAAAGSIAATIQGAASQTADILQVKANGVANSLLSVASAGAVTLRNSSNSTAAFQIQNANNSATLFSVDTSNNLIRILPAGTINNNANASGTGAIQIGADNTTNIGIDDNDIIARNNGSAGTLFLQKTGGGLTSRANAATFQSTTDSTTAFQILSSGGNIALNADTTNARIGIGTNGPISSLDVYKGLTNTGNGQVFNIFSVDSAAAAQNVGGGIGFGGNADSLRAFSAIQGFHESSTASDYAGALRVMTRPSASNDLVEQMRIGSTGQTLFKNSSNSTTAFRIQNANASSTVFSVDTTNAVVTVTALTVSGTLTVNGHIVTGGSTPSIAAGTAACTSPTVSVSGTDTAGLISITTGTGCAASGKMATVSFASAFASAPRVVLTAAESNAAKKSYYVDSATITTAGFDVDVTVANTDATVYKWYYHVIQ